MTATTLPDAVAAVGAGQTEAQFKTFVQNVRAALAELGDPMGVYGAIQNLSITMSVAASALTIAVKDRAGADPTSSAPSSPVSVPFRNVTVATGDYSVLNVTAASSLVISSGSTMGTRANVPFRLWIVAFNDGGTWRIGAINCVTSAAGAGAGSDVSRIYPLAAWGIASSTAEGGSGGADSAQVIYTGTAVTSKAFVVLGYATWESGLGTAGTWSAGPTRIQLFGPGVPLPGQLLQVQRTESAAVATGTTTVPDDDTIPQNTEGDQYLSQAITPTSAANVLRIFGGINALSSTAAGAAACQSLYQDSTANALVSVGSGSLTDANGQITLPHIEKLILAATGSSTTFKVRAGTGSAGTNTINGRSGSRKYGGVSSTLLEVSEIMG